MHTDSKKQNRKSIRLKGYDYTRPNVYFITICVQNMRKVFGEIYHNEVILNKLGIQAKEFWLDIPKHFENSVIDQFVIMPNHIHGIIGLIDDYFLGKPPVGVQYIEPRFNAYQKIAGGSIGSIIRSYKASVTRWANSNGYVFKWQRNYFDRIIRSDKERENIQGYIFYNPVKWYYENGINIEKVFEK